MYTVYSYGKSKYRWAYYWESKCVANELWTSDQYVPVALYIHWASLHRQILYKFIKIDCTNVLISSVHTLYCIFTCIYQLSGGEANTSWI